MNLIMKKTAVTKPFFLIMLVFMTKKICCHGNFSVKVATHEALLKCKAKNRKGVLVKRNFFLNIYLKTLKLWIIDEFQSNFILLKKKSYKKLCICLILEN